MRPSGLGDDWEGVLGRVPWAREKECKGRALRGLARVSENLRGACWVEGPLKERLATGQ